MAESWRFLTCEDYLTTKCLWLRWHNATCLTDPCVSLYEFQSNQVQVNKFQSNHSRLIALCYSGSSRLGISTQCILGKIQQVRVSNPPLYLTLVLHKAIFYATCFSRCCGTNCSYVAADNTSSLQQVLQLFKAAATHGTVLLALATQHFFLMLQGL